MTDQEIEKIRASVEASDQFADLLKATKNDYLKRRIEQSVGNDERASEIMFSLPTALQVLEHGSSREQFGSLLALAFLQKNTSGEFCRLLLQIIQTTQSPDLLNLALFAVGNVYEDSKNQEVIKVLDSLDCGDDKVSESAVSSARSSVLGQQDRCEMPEVVDAEEKIAKTKKWLSELKQRFPNLEEE